MHRIQAAYCSRRRAATAASARLGRLSVRRPVESLGAFRKDLAAGLGDARFGSQAGGASAYRHALRLDDGDWTTWFAIARSTQGPTGRAALDRALALNPRGKELQLFLALKDATKASP